MLKLVFVCLLIRLGYAVTTDQIREWDEAIFNSSLSWEIKSGKPEIVISKDQILPEEVQIEASNNCLSIVEFEGKLFIAWRTAPFHFASSKAKMYIMSRENDGEKWFYEHVIELGADVREPYLLVVQGRLFLYFFQAGTDPIAFEPNQQKRIEYIRRQTWSEIVDWGQPGEISWQYNQENSTTYVSSYYGQHYSTELGTMNLYLNKSLNGERFEPIQDKYQATAINSGGSEVGWNFDLKGNVFGVIRNEDGDESGWGSRIFYADHSSPGHWQYASQFSDPNIYESPRVFRFGNELYLIARTDPNGQFWNSDRKYYEKLPTWISHYLDLGLYSTRAHGTAIWHLDTLRLRLDKVLDLPGCGDTAFPSIIRLTKTKFRVANYSSPLDKCENWPWIRGQLSRQGTQIHFIDIEFTSID